jgi:hypothetical protein
MFIVLKIGGLTCLKIKKKFFPTGKAFDLKGVTKCKYVSLKYIKTKIIWVYIHYPPA